MPELSCQELQFQKTQIPLECFDTKKKQVQLKLRDETNTDYTQTRKCGDSCTGAAVKYIDFSPEKREKEEEAGNAEFIKPEVSAASPLGPLPRTADRSSHLEYWAPLADLTKSRPVVENYSTRRYSPAEWQLHNDRLLKDSRENVEKELLTSFKTHDCMQRAFARTDRDWQDNSIKLSSRLSLVRRWKNELQRELDEYPKEMREIQEERRRLLRCSQALTLIESIIKDVKNVRSQRIESELVRDEVEDELSNEMDLCIDVRNVYVRCLEQVKMQLQELKDAKRRLELDLSDKEEAWDIDVTCRWLNSTSSQVEWKAGSAQLPADQSTPSTYEDHCNEAVVMSQTTLQRSRTLRSDLHALYEKSVHDLRAQADLVDMALSKKVDETVQVCRRMENELSQCLRALADAEALIEETRAGTRRLDGAMKCAQTRLDLRLHRDKVENCRDTPQLGLIKEVKNLSEGVGSMLSQIENTNNVIDDLTKTRQALEKDLFAKRKSLSIDRDRCQLLRSFYPSIQVLAGF